MSAWTRRDALKVLGAASLSSLAGVSQAAFDPLKTNGKRVVVLGGGFGGTIAAKTLRIADPSLEVILIDRRTQHVMCPGSNLVIGGSRSIEAGTFGYAELVNKYGVRYIQEEVSAIDGEKKMIVGSTGSLAYDRLILSPGIDFRFDEIAGYDPASTPQVMPHAWIAGEQTLLLRKQLEGMPDGGTVIVSIPLAPFRCPPGPYERICQMAWYFKQAKPKSKIIVLDANPDLASKAGLFRKGWAKHSAGMIDYRASHKVVKVSPQTMTVHTEVEDLRADVINLIPPQKAARIAEQAGLVGDDKRWCPVDPVTFESKKVPGIHVIGDACIAGPMPKSGFSANSQAKICALNLVATLKGDKRIDPSAANICYSFITDREAVSIAAVYRVTDGAIAAVPGAGGLSPDLSELEGRYARAWLANIRAEMSS
ncbi:MAG TPA: FCSD flavin-binding domain-containing protein [Azonexus sp.]